MPAARNLSNQSFGRLTAVRCDGLNGHKERLWRCTCRCGNYITVTAHRLTAGVTKSCGCLVRDTVARRSLKHGLSQNRTPEYRAWIALRNRCNNPNGQDWKDYGGRGIKVCDRWNSFEAFYADMGPRPSAQHSIDRIDNNGNYEPGNCHWATPIMQANNRRPRARASS